MFVVQGLDKLVRAYALNHLLPLGISCRRGLAKFSLVPLHETVQSHANPNESILWGKIKLTMEHHIPLEVWFGAKDVHVQ